MVPLVDDVPGFAARFGVDVLTMFNMTEINNPIVSEPQPAGAAAPAAACVPACEVRLVDANDCEVRAGRGRRDDPAHRQPWALNHGYHNDPAATARAWRNGWFHTGDAFRQDAEGNYYFVDRVKDAIRRRGENISSFEVESRAPAHPAVREAAAVAVPSEHGEDEVLAVLSLRARRTPRSGRADRVPAAAPGALHDSALRAHHGRAAARRRRRRWRSTACAREGITPDTWDREAAGIRVRREKIGGA